MKDTSKIEQEEALLLTIEKLLDINYKILEITDERLSDLEDQVFLERQKKKGN